MKLRDVIVTLERFAPLSLQDEYDNAGLQIGLTEDAEVSGVLLCLDVTEDVIDEAVAFGCNVVVSHHPLLFHPLRRIAGEDYVQRCVMHAIRCGVAVYSAHTNLDNAPGGVSWRMAEKMRLTDVKVLQPNEGVEGAGAGVVGDLPEAMSADEFCGLLRNCFKLDCVRHNDVGQRSIKRVALCGGAGAFLMSTALRAGADAFVTGEIGYHRFFGYENQMLLAEIGHYESEQYTVDLFADILSPTGVRICKTQLKTNPVRYRV